MQLIVLFNDISPFIGRFHPVFVHLPIGFVLVAFLLEIVGNSDKRFHLKDSVPFVLWLGAFSGVAAAVSGYLLSQSGGYGEEAIFAHQWWGIGVTALVFLTILLYKKKAYMTVFSFTILGIFITGHLGGNLTHGETYLTEEMPEELKNVFGIESDNYIVENVPFEEASLYKHLVYPILHDKCVSCHNNSKMKGELNMKDFKAFLKGGENGEVVLLGNIEKSNLLKRLKLREDHEDTMPPEGKERVDEDEMKLISLWVDQDLEEDTPLDSLDISKDILEDIKFRLAIKESLSPVFDKNITTISDATLEKLRTFGFNVLPIKKGDPFLQVTYFDRTIPISKQSKKALLAIAEQLVWLDLTGAISDNNNWDFLNSLPNLTKIYLSNTKVTDLTIMALEKNEFLEIVSLFGTSASNDVLEPLLKLKHLKSLYLANSNVNPKDTISLDFGEHKNLKIHF